MADLIQVNSHNPNVLMVARLENYGGVTFTIGEGHQLKEMLDWYKNYQEQLVKESKAREQFESVATAYESYQTALKLVLDMV